MKKNDDIKMMPMNWVKFKETYGFGVKIFVTLTSVLILYWRDLVIVSNEALNSEMASHILALPFLLGYVLYRKRRRLFACASGMANFSQHNTHVPFEKISGILLCVLSYLMSWYGSYTFHTLEIHLLSLPICISGLVLLIFNYNTFMALLFPIFFLAFLVPPPLELVQITGSALSVYSSQASFTILRILQLPVSLSYAYGGPLIYLKVSEELTIPFAIDLACSGLYSLIGFTIFAVFTAYIARGNILKKISVFALGFPIIYALNIVRITIIVLVGYIVGPTFILNIIHLLGGWTLIFAGTFLLFIVSEKVFKIRLFSVDSNSCSHSELSINNLYCVNCGKILEIPSTRLTNNNIIGLFFVIIISISLFFVQVPVFTLSQGGATILSQQSVGQPLNIGILPEIEGYELSFVYRDTAFENISGQDASLMYAYQPEDLSESVKWVGIEIGPTKLCLHAWEVCLITYPQTQGRDSKVTKIDLRDFHLLENPPLNSRYFAFQEQGSDIAQVILYWYTRSVFQINSGFQKKWVKISVIMYSPPEEFLSAEQALLPLATDIATYWEPLSSWSWVGLVIAKNGWVLIMLTGILVMFIQFYGVYLNRLASMRAKRMFSNVSDPLERLIVETVRTLDKEDDFESGIIHKIEEVTGEKIDVNILRRKLFEAEDAGILRRKIVVINDEPHIAWKLTF